MQTQVECSRKSTPRRRNHGRTYTRSLFACCLKRCLNPLPPLHLTCIFSTYFLLNSEHMAHSSKALFQQKSLETFASNQNLCDWLVSLLIFLNTFRDIYIYSIYIDRCSYIYFFILFCFCLSECIEWPFSTSRVYWSPSCHAEGMLHLMRTISLQASTEADVSFFSTLGCSLRGALTTGSMALALLSPFICTERTLAAAPVCRWLSFYLASPLSLSSPDSWLPQPAAARRQVLGLQKHANPPQTHLCNERLWCIWILTPCTPIFFFFWLTLPPFSPVCLSHSYSLSGFF